jgi:hypothetical protein
MNSTSVYSCVYCSGVISSLYVGSEHSIDSMYHSAGRRAETAQINASLAALKDVVRARAQAADFDSVYLKVSHFRLVWNLTSRRVYIHALWCS